jgi:hypothetical protein
MPALSHPNLRKALASNLGQFLTPEIAAQIEMAAFDLSDNSHSPSKFGEQEYKGFLFRVELLRDIVDEIHPLHEKHFAETEIHRLGFGLDLDYDYMQDMERQGRLIQFTCRARDTGMLVGNIRMYVQKSLHTGTLYASEDTFYVLPEYRRGFAALRFWQFMEDCLKSIGVREVRTDSKVINRVHKLNEYIGYKHVANKYVKIFTE